MSNMEDGMTPEVMQNIIREQLPEAMPFSVVLREFNVPERPDMVQYLITLDGKSVPRSICGGFVVSEDCDEGEFRSMIAEMPQNSIDRLTGVTSYPDP